MTPYKLCYKVAQDRNTNRGNKMKLTIERNALINVLKHTTGVVEKRNTIAVLSNILIDAASNETVMFVATDMEIEVSEFVDLENRSVKETGSVTLPAQTLFDIVRKMNGDEVTIQTEDNGQVSISSGRSKFKLSTLPVADFPQMPVNEADCSFVINATDFAGLLNRVRFAMSVEDTRYYLNGVYLHSSGDTMKCIATDSHRLAIAEMAKPEGMDLETGVIVPRKTINEVMKILDETSGDICVSISSSKISFAIGSIVIQSKLIDGTYPDYMRVVPQGNDKLLTVDVDSFVSAVDRVATVSNEKTRAIKLELLPNELSLLSSANGSNAKDIIEATFDGEPMDIGFNARYLLDVLASLKNKDVKIAIGSPESPAVFEEENALYVLMLMRVQ